MADKPLKRPDGVLFWTADDIAAWIELNINNSGGRIYAGTPKDAALWWHCYNLAGQMRDLNMRELTELVMEGSAPTTLDDLTESLQGQWAELNEDPIGANLDEQIERDLNDFYKGGIE